MVDITPLINAIIALLAAGISVFVIPYVRKKAKAEDLKELQSWVQVGVKMAEQLAKAGIIDKEDRKSKVLEFLSNKGYQIDFDSVEAMIEASVSELPSFTESNK